MTYEFRLIVSDLQVGDTSIEARGAHPADSLAERLLFFNLVYLFSVAVKIPNFSIQVFHPFDPK